MGFLIRFEDERALDPRMVGHKFSALARAFRTGFAVPQAVVIQKMVAAIAAGIAFGRNSMKPARKEIVIEVDDLKLKRIGTKIICA